MSKPEPPTAPPPLLQPAAEHQIFVYQVAARAADSSPVVINELMADNKSTIQNPQGGYEDWIELYNLSDREVDLSGMYLSDREDRLKWIFPPGLTLAPGALVFGLRTVAGKRGNDLFSVPREAILLLEA